MELEPRDVLLFQAKRDFVHLYKSFLIMLEDLEKIDSIISFYQNWIDKQRSESDGSSEQNKILENFPNRPLERRLCGKHQGQ